MDTDGIEAANVIALAVAYHDVAEIHLSQRPGGRTLIELSAAPMERKIPQVSLRVNRLRVPERLGKSRWCLRAHARPECWEREFSEQRMQSQVSSQVFLSVAVVS
jgi:hypothetical protein